MDKGFNDHGAIVPASSADSVPVESWAETGDGDIHATPEDALTTADVSLMLSALAYRARRPSAYKMAYRPSSN